jgi:hypothetical protein
MEKMGQKKAIVIGNYYNPKQLLFWKAALINTKSSLQAQAPVASRRRPG